ncbi:E3 ubiquitin-protein ligase UPL7 [Phragmites australis]|uniref:E3 ubiquitin-protein ligase UPL7 n=1 Tax=Phragmites australis TaxID=29695 RepID=UPI002D782A16|nr:E3 ubiquitin-protein ligase UPL7 [Phragmites australis]
MSVPPAGNRQVSLRGSSAREITRDALLQKVSEERQLRSHLRRAAAAALSIQRVWRKYYVIRMVSEQLHEDWELLINQPNISLTNQWISSKMLRPFLFFITQPSSWYKGQQSKTVKSVFTCFKIILNSINSKDASKNFCSFAVGMPEERSIWLYQAKKLISLCSSILARCDYSCCKDGDMVDITVIAMRLAVSLTDCKTWKSLKSDNARAADACVESLIEFIGASQSATFNCVRKYIKCLGPHATSGKKTSAAATDDQFLITASAVTVALRPFHSKIAERSADLNGCSKEYFTLILTIPYLCKRMPPLLLPALKHISVLQPCLSIVLIYKDTIFEKIIKLEQSEVSTVGTSIIPCSGWALGNIVNLATVHDELSNSGCFIQGLDFCLYVDAINCISQNLLKIFEESTGMSQCVGDTAFHADTSLPEEGDTNDNCSMITLFMDLLKPIYQQWHLRKLLMLAKEDVSCGRGTNDDPTLKQIHFRSLKLSDVICFYYHMLRIFSVFNPSFGALPILNMLAFTPGFLVDLWGALEITIFGRAQKLQETGYDKQLATSSSGEQISSMRQRKNVKDTANKWANVLQKITGKSSDSEDGNHTDSILNSQQCNDDALTLWDIETMRRASEGIGKDLMCMLHLFCAIYGHLLLVLDDIEFYEKQVPFTLEQQRKIASALNTFVYNSFVQNGGSYNKPLIDVAVRCLNLLYERDSRHKFCPISLWLAPARNGRIPIAAAARAHEAAFGNFPVNHSSGIPTRNSVLTTLPHVYPFEERVQIFREFIESDKASRKVTGEVSGPGPGSIEIVIRRGHIIEDGYRQLNCLRSKLKSCIHVSFVSECGLPEAGLDYGGLSKEFLTDLSKAAFSPEYGLFSQTSVSDSSLIPSNSAKLLDNSIDMLEFLGRVVGKALYEGILLDYSFSQVFVQKLLGRYSFLDELSTLDPELYRNLMQLKHYDGDVEDLCLDFTAIEELGGKRIVHELRPGGKNISVTNENKLHYVHAIADFKLNRQIRPFANAFYRGLSDLISPSWLSLFNANEFNQLLSGGLQDFDVDDLRNNTKYTGGYTESSRTVKLFWEVIKGFKPMERCLLLKFVTSCSRAPLLGFKYLQPSFTIHKVPCDVTLWASIGGQDVDRLPSASTCYNTLKLPTYKRSNTLRSKLLYAINSNTGFELS